MDRTGHTEARERVPGWGADADPSRRPGVPFEGGDALRPGARWEAPSQQASEVEILTPQGRPRTPVFGTAAPPHGLSGALRRVAYRYPDHLARRWMLLLLGDRVDAFQHKLRRGPQAVIGYSLWIGGLMMMKSFTPRV